MRENRYPLQGPELRGGGSVAYPGYPYPGSGTYPEYPTTAAATRTLPMLLKRALLGRVRLLVILVVVLGSIAGGLGWFIPDDLYAASGLLYIDPTVPSVRDPMGRSVQPNFSGFMSAQISLLRGERVRQKAMESRAWQSLGRGSSPAVEREFAASLSVGQQRNSQMVGVTFIDREPRAALVGLQEVMSAFREVATDFNSKASEDALGKAQEQQLVLATQLEDLKRDIQKLTTDYGGAAGLAATHLAYVSQVTELRFQSQRLWDLVLRKESDLAREKKEAAKKAEESGAEGEEPGAEGEEPGAEDEDLGAKDGDADADRLERELTAEEIRARGDVEMIQMLMKQAMLEGQLSDYRELDGLGENHQSVVGLKRELKWVALRIEERRRLYNLSAAARAASRVGSGQVDLSLGELRGQYDLAKVALERALTDAKTYGEAQVKYETLMGRKEALEVKQEQLKEATEYLRENPGQMNRIVEFEKGSLPTAPFKDNRIRSAITGAGMGAVAGFLIVLAIGLLDRRMKSSIDAASGMPRLRLLGLVPKLPAIADGERQTDLAAHCIHEIRALLQIQVGRETGRLISITGPVPGSGKSTVSLALGLSFASSGSRTLLVDCDFIGRGLTRTLRGMLRSMLEEAATAREAGASGESIGNGRYRPNAARIVGLLRAAGERRTTNLEVGLAALVDTLADENSGGMASVNGLLDSTVLMVRELLAGDRELDIEPSEISRLRAFVAQATGSYLDEEIRPTDIIDVLGGVELEKATIATAVPNLYCVAAGRASPDYAGIVSLGALSRLVEQARESFDTVLIDTGPIPGSLEASMSAALSDGVVLVVSRGGERTLAERSVASLTAVNANFAGFVFNRALTGDVLSRSTSYIRQDVGPLSEDGEQDV